MVKIREEINEIENRKTIGKTNKIKSLFYKMLSKSDKHLARLTKKKRRGRIKLLKWEMKEGTVQLTSQTWKDYKVIL